MSKYPKGAIHEAIDALVERATMPGAKQFYDENVRLLAGRVRELEAARDPEQVARRFHEEYERLAPSYGYETRRESAVPWADVPEQNKALMIAVAGEVLAALAASPVERDD